MQLRRQTVSAALATLAVAGGSLAYSATASAQDRADRTPDPGMAGMHELMGRQDPGMARMHELMTERNPGMLRMHELMSRQDPGMARMHERMTDSSR